MCGLAGYYLFGGARETTNKPILYMLRLQRHRGPDDSGMVAIDTETKLITPVEVKEAGPLSPTADLLFGFNRLSILDTSINGHQPMISNDEQVVIMLNGEIYNAFDYRDALIAKGYKFRSFTDTEVVLNLYLEYGFDKMIRMLNGMFAIVIYDARNNELYLVRDRFGIKPLYLLQEKDRIAFTSEIKSFKGLPGFRFEDDFSNLDEFLLFRNLIHRTLFKNIINITPGEYITVARDGCMLKKTFYRLCEEGHISIAEPAAYNAMESALESSVKRQMISDVKLGCQLSGGVDSSLVSYYAARHVSKGQLETVSIIFDDPSFSEEKYINEAANALSLQAHQFRLDANYYFGQFEKASWHFEQPLNHPNTIGIYLLSQEAKKHVTVLLSGEGADETLAGYERFASFQQPAYFSRHFLMQLKKNKGEWKSFFQYYNDADSRMIMGAAFGAIPVLGRLYPSFNLNKALSFRREMTAGLSGNADNRHRKYEILTYLPDLLMRQDKMSMAHSIENRVPFLDNEMVSVSLSIPGAMLTADHKGIHETKLLLKELCAEKFNEGFAFRNKMGFGIPLKEFMQSAGFRERWEDQHFPAIRKRGLFNAGELEWIMKNIKTASSGELEAIWLTMGFETWAKQYLAA